MVNSAPGQNTMSARDLPASPGNLGRGGPTAQMPQQFKDTTARRQWWLLLLAFGVSMPPLYLFVMTQYGGIVFPYWDHMPTAKYIIQYFDGTLTLRTLAESHNEARPLLPRLIFVVNAALTNWDVRSEYIYIYLTIYGALAALLFALGRLARQWPPAATLTAALLISVIACSPVAAMNHFWSLMLMATLCYLFTIGALLVFSMAPLSWPANVTAAVLTWMAVYSVSQGLFLFPVVILLHQMIAPKMFVPTRWSMFWLVNMLVCCALYIPGSYLGKGVTPAMLDFIAFMPVYLGNPLGSLLWFPEGGVVWLRETSIINAICGLLLIGLSGATAWRALPELRARRPEAVTFFSFALYAGACTVTTAWGRANGIYAVATANSSRYSVWPAILLFGLIIYYTSKYARRELIFSGWHKAALGIFLIASTVSYVRAVPVYKSAHDDNVWLANAYSTFDVPDDLAKRAFPDPDYFRTMKADMLRLGIGPFKSIPQATSLIYANSFVSAVALNPGTVLTQRFKTTRPKLRAISFKVVTWATTPSDYRFHWKVVGQKSGAVLGEGTVATPGLTDWQTLSLKLSGSNDEHEIEVTFSVDNVGAVARPVGIALYQPSAAAAEPAVVNGTERADEARIGFDVHYYW